MADTNGQYNTNSNIFVSNTDVLICCLLSS